MLSPAAISSVCLIVAFMVYFNYTKGCFIVLKHRLLCASALRFNRVACETALRGGSHRNIAGYLQIVNSAIVLLTLTLAIKLLAADSPAFM